MARDLIRARRFALVLPKRYGGWESKQQDGAEVGMEKRTANRCQAWISSEHIANVAHPPHSRPMEMLSFALSRKAGSRPSAQAMTCSLSIPTFCPIVSSRALLEDRL